MRSVCVIAAYNEEKRISRVIRGVKKFVKNVIVVDDGSTDKTASASRKAGASVISYEKNRGKGYALRLGIKRALKQKPDIILFLDADLQHDPKYIPQFINKLEDGADYVYGFRDMSCYPLNRKIGNFGLSFLVNIICPVGIWDTECGYRALTLEAVKKLSLKADRYGIEMDFAYSAYINKFKIKRVDVSSPVFHPKPAVIRGFRNFFYLLERRFE